MSWEPQPEGLNQIITLLKQSQSTDNNVQRAVQQVSLRYFNEFAIFIFNVIECHLLWRTFLYDGLYYTKKNFL